MAIITSTFLGEEPATENSIGAWRHTKRYELLHNDPTDALFFSVTGGRSASPDAVPQRGATFAAGGSSDLGSFASRFNVAIPNRSKPTLRHVIVEYEPLSRGNSQAKLQQPNPLLWPTEYWLEWVEEQVPLEKALLVSELSAFTPEPGTLGPLVNAANEEFTEPVMTTEFYNILVARRNFATLNPIIALNTQFQRTKNASTYFGAPPGQAKYLLTRSDRQQQVGEIVYYPSETRIAFRKGGWNREILNRGYHCVKLNEVGIPSRQRAQIEDDKGNKKDSPSPVNLNLDGSQRDVKLQGIFVEYDELDPVNYDGIGIGS